MTRKTLWLKKSLRTYN